MKKKNKDPWDKENEELWDLDCTIAEFVLPRLKKFRKITNSYPDDFENIKEWKKALKKMIIAFDLIISYNNERIEHVLSEKKIKKGLKLFHKYFRMLWL